MRNSIMINTGRRVTNGNGVFLYIFRISPRHSVEPPYTNWTHNTSSPIFWALCILLMSLSSMSVIVTVVVFITTNSDSLVLLSLFVWLRCIFFVLTSIVEFWSVWYHHRARHNVSFVFCGRHNANVFGSVRFFWSGKMSVPTPEFKKLVRCFHPFISDSK